MPADRSTKLLLIVLAAMFVQQAFATIGRTLPPIIAPAILQDFALDPAWLGVYVGAAALAALLFQLGCGSFILRYGAMRMSQVALVLLGLGMAIATVGPVLLLLVSGVIGGGAAAMSTPASSHLLGRYSPPRQAPLVFSIKQTAVPAGLLAAGILGPWLTGLSGWRGTMLVAGVACLVFALMLEPSSMPTACRNGPSASRTSTVRSRASSGRPSCGASPSPASPSTACRRCSPPISWWC